MAKNSFEEPRSILRRLVIEGTLVLESPAHLGGSDPADITDMPIARDALDKVPILYGTTLAGLLRHCLYDRLAGKGKSSSFAGECIKKFFGGEEDDDDQSFFIIDDARCKKAALTDLRDGVAIELETGTAADREKFDYELLRIGTEFPVHFELLLFSGAEEDSQAISFLLTCLDALEKKEIYLGARSRKGFGRCSVKVEKNRATDYVQGWRWRVRDFDLTAHDGYKQWIAYDRDETGRLEGWPEAASECYASAKDMLDRKFSGFTHPCTIHGAPYKEFAASLPILIDGSVIIRSEGDPSGASDHAHLARYEPNNNKSQPILAGTSLGGIIRARAAKIVRTLTESNEDHIPKENNGVNSMINNLFGASKDSDLKTAGKVFVEEVPISGGVSLRHTRTMIDRWTGGSLEHHLFTEDVQVEGSAEIDIRIVQPTDKEIGLLLLVIKDLATGDLPIGGESSVGRGRMIGQQGQLTYVNENNKVEKWTIGLADETDGSRRLKVISGDGSRLNWFISQFREGLGSLTREVSHGNS